MSYRRQTLGALSSSSVNSRRHTSFEAGLRQPTKAVRSRQSLAPKSNAKKNGVQKQKRRQTLASGTRPSFGAGPGARKSMNGRRSMGGRSSVGRLSMAPKKSKNSDPRPIKKRAFMEQEVKEVIRFLVRHQYDHPITPKQLTKPTAKDFENIVLFLFGVVDNNYHFSGNIKTDVPLFFKGLGYPFTLSPAALCAVGAPNTWPSMLASLSWLIELLSYDDVVSQDEADQVDGEQAHKRFFRFLINSYTAFLSGEDDVFEDLSDEMEKYFDAKNKTIGNDVAAADQKILMLQEEHTSLTEAKSIIPGLREEVAVLESDISKHKEYMARLESYKDGQKAKLNEARNTLKDRELYLKELQQKKKRLETTISNQAFSAQEFQGMCKERSRKRNALVAAQKEKDTAQAEIWDIETRRTAQMEDLEQLVKEYNSLAQQLQLCPAEAKYANGQDFAVKLNAFDSKKSLLSVDMKSFVKPTVKDLNTVVAKDAVKLNTESLRLQERINDLDERKQEISNTNKSLKATLDRQESALSEEKDRLAQTAAELQKSIDDLRIATTKLASADVSQRKEILAQREQVQELQTARASAAEVATAEEEQLHLQIHRTAQLIANHEERQQATLKKFSGTLQTALDSIC